MPQPRNRRTIAVLRPEHIERLEYASGGTSFLKNDEIRVLDFEQGNSPADPPYLKDLRNRRDFGPGRVYIQSPFDQEKYLEISAAAEDLALQKYSLWTEICGLLGATRITVEKVESTEESSHRSGEVSVKTGPVKAGGSILRDRATALREKLTLDTTFPGSSPDVEEARAKLAERGVQDEWLQSMVNLRSAGRNPVKEQTLTLDLSKEAKNSISGSVSAAFTGIPSFPYGISGEAKAAVATFTKQSYSLKVKVTF